MPYVIVDIVWDAIYRAPMRDPERRQRGGARHSWATVPPPSALGLLVLGIALSGCGPAATTSIPATTPTATAASSGSADTAQATVQQPPTSAPSTSMREASIAIGHDRRVVELFVPTTPAGMKAPLLVLLHASGESPSVMADEAGAGRLAAREGVIVALPPAQGRRWDASVPSGNPITPSADMDYVIGLIERLATDLPVNRERVFVAGFSIGAVMTERIACQAANRVAVVALDAGAPWSDTCVPAQPVPVLVMHGTADNTFPIALAGELVDRWLAADRCTGAPVVTQLTDIATALVNADCADGATVEYVRYRDVGHRWFTDPDATEVMWKFFSEHAPR